jgi:hypothetical protein
MLSDKGCILWCHMVSNWYLSYKHDITVKKRLSICHARCILWVLISFLRHHEKSLEPSVYTLIKTKLVTYCSR